MVTALWLWTCEAKPHGGVVVGRASWLRAGRKERDGAEGQPKLPLSACPITQPPPLQPHPLRDPITGGQVFNIGTIRNSLGLH